MKLLLAAVLALAALPSPLLAGEPTVPERIEALKKTIAASEAAVADLQARMDKQEKQAVLDADAGKAAPRSHPSDANRLPDAKKAAEKGLATQRAKLAELTALLTPEQQAAEAETAVAAAEAQVKAAQEELDAAKKRLEKARKPADPPAPQP